MSNEETNPQNSISENGKPQEVHIVVNRHKKFFEMLESPRQIYRAALLMFGIVFLFFLGLALVALTVKSKVPYNVIKANQYGALLMQTEDKEISNIMYNTAEFLANSGIEVEENDLIDIKATGRFNTTIHYLVDKNIDARWIDPDGAEPRNERDRELGEKECLLVKHKKPQRLMCVIMDKDGIKKYEEYIKYQSRVLKNHNDEVWLDKAKDVINILNNRINELDNEINKIKESKKVDNRSGNKRKELTIKKDKIMLEIKELEKELEEYVKQEKEPEIKKSDNSIVNKRDSCLTSRDSCLTSLVDHIKNDIEDVGSHREFHAKKSGILFFVINDVLFTKEVRETIKSNSAMFMNSWGDPEDFSLDTLRFGICPDAWYLDNTGSFLITIEKSKKN